MSDSTYDVILPKATTRRTIRYGRRTLYVVAPALVAVGLITLWEAWVRLGDVAPVILPAPSTVATRMWDQWSVLWPEAWVTIQEIVIGFGLAVVFGFVCAILIVAIRPIELTIYPILVASQVIPKIAIAPLIFIWFGLGDTSRLIIIVMLSFFPIVIATVIGLKSVEPAKLYLARSTGAGTIRTFLKIRIPQALPDMFSGLKLGATRAVGAAIVAEFISSGAGLGRSIFLATYDLRPDIALAGVGYLVIIGLVFFFAVTAAERLLVPWHVSVRGSRR
jgi:NitT/TauT family transport system permease protein